MRFLVVEDIKSTCEMIVQMIKEIEGNDHVIDKSLNQDDAYLKVLENDYDILFLDINLPRGTSFDLLKKILEKREIKSQIIFLTGQKEREYLMSAIKFSAIDYLYKPIDEKELREAIEKAKGEIANQEKIGQVGVLMELVANEKNLKNSTVAFHLPKGKIVNLNTKDIIHMSAEGPITQIILENGSNITAIRNLGFYKEFLQEHCGFFLISKSTLINLDQLESYDHKNLLVSMKNGMDLNCSRRGGKQLKEHLQSSLSTPSIWTQLKNFLNN